MRAASPRSRSQHRLAWLLWLALLLPLAQAAATWHGLSHLAQQTAGDRGDAKHAAQSLPCELCLTAVAVSGGALPGAPPPMPGADAGHEAPHAAFSGGWLALVTAAYRSRAPPAASL